MNDQATGVKWILGLLGISIPAGLAGIAIANRNYTILVWGLLAFAIFVGIGLGIFFLWKRWKSKQESAQFTSAFDQEASAAPRELSAAEERKRLDDLRKKFQEGVLEFKRRKLSMYEAPWFLMVGEPGSGKTFAIKKSTLEFAIEHADEGVAGIAGTVNMNWWFTQLGIIIDTAGKLLFEGLKPGQSGQWREFLALLKKHRPYAPINGLILVIPADSLIRDDSNTIEQKGKTIFSQLDLLQRTLDVRFPVFILITKSDLIPGFREYFDDLKDPERQYQILGWSNKEPLDTFVKAGDATAHLKSIAERLQRRRLSLMKDPSPEEPGVRRVDEVDSMFAFPNNLALLETNLRRYLEIIFRQGTWALPPLFLRGIYFTSSIREGQALNDAVAAALGVDASQLERHTSMRRDTPLFLRDFFREKVFREKGLVTAASNVRSMLRKRSILGYGAGFAVMILLAVLFVAGNYQLQNSIGTETGLWKAAASTGWENDGTWRPIVSKEGAGYSYNGAKPVEGIRGMTLTRFHRELGQTVNHPVKLGIFAPLGGLGNIQDGRKDAQRILFEKSIIVPTLTQTRAKMTGQRFAELADLKIRGQQQDALIALIKLEGDLASKAVNAGHLDTNSFRTWLTYVAGTDIFASDTNLVETFRLQQGYKLPESFSGGSALAANAAIANGVDLFLQGAAESTKTISDRIERLKVLIAALEKFRATEDQLLAKAKTGAIDPALIQELEPQVAPLVEQVQVFTTNKWGLGTNGFSLVKAYSDLQGEANQSTNAFAKLTDAAKANTGIFAEILGKVSKAQEQMTSMVSGSLDRQLLAALDDRFLTYDSSHKTIKIAVRADLYRRTRDLLQETPFKNTLGRAWQPYVDYKKRVDQIRTDFAGYRGGFEEGVSEIAKRLADALDQTDTASFNEYTKTFRAWVEKVNSDAVLDKDDPDTFDTDAVVKKYKDLKAELELYRTDIQAAPGKLPSAFIDVTRQMDEGAKFADGRLTVKYVTSLDRQIVLDFPLSVPRPGRPALTPKELRARLLIAEKVRASLPAGASGGDLMRTLTAKLDAIKELAAFLVDDRENAVNYSITPLPPAGPIRDYAASLWRSARFNKGNWRSTETGESAGRNPPERFAADKSLNVELCTVAGIGAKDCEAENGLAIQWAAWGAIELLLSDKVRNVKQIKEDTYTLELDVTGAVAGTPVKKTLGVKIEFDKRAPRIDQWPDLAKK